MIDLSTLNKHLDVPHFKMESQHSIRSVIRPGEYTTSIDSRDAYLHILMASSVQRYLKFRVGRNVYQFRSLPFRLSTSPQEFKILCPIIHVLRCHGIRVHPYLEDWLIGADTVLHGGQLVAAPGVEGEPREVQL